MNTIVYTLNVSAHAPLVLVVSVHEAKEAHEAAMLIQSVELDCARPSPAKITYRIRLYSVESVLYK